MATHFTPTKENTNMTDKNTYLSMRGTHMSTGITKMYRLAQSGRSMVEMLGVLAIVGVLSIGGIMGYDYAVAKFRANTIMSELNLRAVPISQQLTQHPEEANTALTLEAGDTLSSGQSVSANVAVNPEYFEFHLTEVDDTTCELVLENYETPAWMMVNGSLYENSTDICSNPDNDMTFVYKNDLGERRNCSSKGFFNLETYKCDCGENMSFNKDTKDCVCLSGYIWSAKEHKCIESRCAPGEFESSTDGCVSCDDPNAYSIQDAQTARNLCETCPNRIANLVYPVCVNMDNCEKMVSFPQMHNNTECHLCTSDQSSFWIDHHEKAYEYCNACSNRYASNHGCILNDFCQSAGTTFIYQDSNHSASCAQCSDSKTYTLGHKDRTHDNVKSLCLACKNAAGISNREIVKDDDTLYCVKKLCDTDEFMGADGKCYKCSQSQSIIINDFSGCSVPTCGRTQTTINNQKYCILSACDTSNHKNVLLSDGSCWNCAISSVFSSTKEECNACGTRADGEIKRGWIGDDENTIGECRLNKCTLGTNFYTPSGCSLCSNTSFAGKGEYAQQYCEACGNYSVEQTCYTDTFCSKGTEFISELKCFTCSYTQRMRLADHDKHRELCSSCSLSKRFFADDNYCYPCNTKEKPTVTTTEARNSCMSCPNRTINADGQCIYILTEE